MSSPLKIRTILLFLIVLPAFVPGCSLWDSATSYFNTYYNAQKVFVEAENDIWTQKDLQRVGRNYYFGPIVNANKVKFTSVIEKCSKLLQYHPESGLVDDALMMIGMSYYYTDDNQAAERKFRELLDKYPDSKLAPRGKMMLAYTYYRMNNKDTAAIAAKTVYESSKEEGDDAVAGHAAMLLGRIEQERQNFEQARQYYVAAGEYGENPELRVTAYLAAADVAEKASDYANAQTAYLLAQKTSRTYVGEFRGQLGAARMRMRLGDFAGSLEALQRLRANTNYKEFWSEVEYETGNCYRLEGRIDDAILKYSYVDTAFARTESAANADYQLGQLYEYTVMNLDSARVAYTRGRNQTTTAIITPILTKKAETLGRYVQYRNDLVRMDSIRRAWVLVRDSILARQDSINASAAVKPGPPDTVITARAMPGLPDSVVTTRAKPGLPDSVVTARAKPGTPDTVVTARAKPGMPDTVVTARARPGLPDTVVTARPKLVLPNIDSLDQRVANTKIELATLFYTSIERPDSAMYWYKRFVAEYPSNPGVPRSLYTMGQIIGQDSTKSAGSADSLYREIIQRFPSSEFASESRKILGLPPDTQSIDPAQLEYTRAQNLVLSGNFADAVSGFRRVVDQYPKSLLASRAQYAIGWIYENQLIAPDSAIANYKILISTYPTSPFVSLVQAKLTEVQLERSGARKDTVKATKDVKLDQPVPPKKAEETVGKGRRARQQEVPDKLPEKE